MDANNHVQSAGKFVPVSLDHGTLNVRGAKRGRPHAESGEKEGRTS